MGEENNSPERADKRRHPVLAALGVLVVLAAAAAIGVFFYCRQATLPVDPRDSEDMLITIPSGTGAQGIGSILYEEGLIRDDKVFRAISRMQGLDGNYQAGAYLLSKRMGMQEIMGQLIEGANALKRFTIPEGYTIAQTGSKLAAEGLVDPGEFMEVAASGMFSYDFLKGLPNSENRLEGYLYPETYDVYVGASETDIIDRMLAQFNSLFSEAYYLKAEEMGYTAAEIVTIASLIEMETKVPEERPIVASVIHNRLKKGMQLQIDASVQYALGEHKDRLLNSDLEVLSPYNTYKYPGLPPGPICSPRIDCIDAALNPADTDFIYYVLKAEMNGAHNFTASYNEFLRFKDEYKKAL